MTGRCNGETRHDLVAIHDQIVDLHVHIRKCFEIPAQRCLRARKSLPGTAVMLRVILRDNIPESVGIVRIEGRDASPINSLSAASSRRCFQ